MDYVFKLVGVNEEYQQKKYKNYSQGYKQRMLVARSFLTNSNMVLLDEPFIAVDLPTINLLKKATLNFVTTTQKAS
jgi:ABC-type nitrate/sulfonate/bicarbonate transport system ATPase subunit